jgi:hypothetical protein
MPKKEIDYSNTIIYKITCNDINNKEVYVGHTTNFVQRKHSHKQSCINEKSLNYKCKLYEVIRNNGGWDNWTMEILNFFNCKDHYEARIKEQEYFMLLNATLNSIEPFPKPKLVIEEKKESLIFYCDKCNIYCNTLNLLELHNLTKKHNKFEKKNTTNLVPKSSAQFCCEQCDYYTTRKSQYDRHLSTPKHQNTTNTTKSSEKFVCEKCDKIYKHHSSLWNHKKKCYSNKNQVQGHYKINELETIEPSTKEIIDLVRLQIIENQELRKIMLSQQQQIIELTTKPSITNTNCNNVNNSFNLNLFLNEKCKDAINITDFVDNVKMQLSDLENFGNLGYVEGVSRILIKNLNEMDTYSRPIHCSDLKRDVLYIKDNNQWTKEQEDKPILKNAIKQVANKNIKQIQIWKNENPDCTYADSRKNDQYLKIVLNSMSGGTNEEQQTNISQIVKNISKVVTIDKMIEK